MFSNDLCIDSESHLLHEREKWKSHGKRAFYTYIIIIVILITITLDKNKLGIAWMN